MTNTAHALVARQFSPRAAAYVQSAVHAQGEDLAELADFARRNTFARALDLGCGGGHVSFAIAPHVGEVVAYDLSDEMLAAVAAKVISLEPTKASATRRAPISRWRVMFSSTMIASSTTIPIAKLKASRVKVFIVNPQK